MSNTPMVSTSGYPNKVLEDMFTDLLNTKLATRSFMTIDNSLTQNAGTKKVVNVYTFTGSVETVAEGSGNTVSGLATYTTKEYNVVTKQQKFGYTDESIMTDPNLLDMAVRGSADLMTNDLNNAFFTELNKSVLEQSYATAITYDAVVDAISLMNIEDESGLFLLIGNDLKAAIRKDSDFVSARQGEIIFNGQIGTVAGVPVIVSKLLPIQTAYLATKEAVTMFIKKESEVEQDRDADKRITNVYLRKVGVVALTDATKLVKIAKAQSGTTAVTTYVKDDPTVAGSCPAGCDVIEVYINGVLDGTTTFIAGDTDAFTYEATSNLAVDDEIYVICKQVGYVSKTSATVTVVA